MPILSICIPAYNRPVWLKRAILSVIEQRFSEDIELIISDDSTDTENSQIAEKILSNWTGKWQYLHNIPSLGMSQNWNRSIELANGSYILLLHDDDFLYPNSLQAIISTIKSQTKLVFLFGAAVVDENEQILKYQRVSGYLCPKKALIEVLSNSSFVRFPAIVIAKEAFEYVGFFKANLAEPADLEMWVRLFRTYGVFCKNTITCAYTVHSQALTMGIFTERTIVTILSIFEQASPLLSEQELAQCQNNFFYQFILAGAFRMLRRGYWEKFRQTMELFEFPQLQHIKSPSWFWSMLRCGFSMLSQQLAKMAN